MKMTPTGYRKLVDITYQTDDYSISDSSDDLTRSSVIDRIQFQPPLNTPDVTPPPTKEKLNSSRIRLMR